MRLGDYTVDGGILFDAIGTAEANYLFDSTARTAVGNADFVIVSCILSTTGIAIEFDVQGDGGSGTLVAKGTGTSTAKNAIWGISPVVTVLFIPASIFGTTDTTRTGRIRASTASSDIYFQFCSWNPSSNP